MDSYAEDKIVVRIMEDEEQEEGCEQVDRVDENNKVSISPLVE